MATWCLTTCTLVYQHDHFNTIRTHVYQYDHLPYAHMYTNMITYNMHPCIPLWSLTIGTTFITHVYQHTDLWYAQRLTPSTHSLRIWTHVYKHAWSLTIYTYVHQVILNMYTRIPTWSLTICAHVGYAIREGRNTWSHVQSRVCLGILSDKVYTMSCLCHNNFDELDGEKTSWFRKYVVYPLHMLYLHFYCTFKVKIPDPICSHLAMMAIVLSV